MADKAQGHKAFVQMAEETTFDTFAASRRKMEIVSFNVSPVIGTIPDPSLHDKPSARAIYQGGLFHRGTMVVRCGYEGYMMLVKGAMGSVTTAVVGGETVVRDHSFIEASSLPSYSIEVIEGFDGALLGKAVRYTGCKISSLAIRGVAGQGLDAMLQIEVGIIAKTKDTNAGSGYTPTASFTVAGGGGSGGSPVITTTGDFIAAGVAPGQAISGTGVGAGAKVLSITSATSLTATVNNAGAVSGTLTFALDFPALVQAIYHHPSNSGGIVDSGVSAAATIRIRSFEVTLENALAEDRFYIGALSPDEAIRNERLVARWRIVQEYQNHTAYESFLKTFADVSPELKFVHPDTIGTGAVRRHLLIRSNKGKIMEFGAPIEGYGVILNTMVQEAYHDTVDVSALFIQFRNMEAAA